MKRLLATMLIILAGIFVVSCDEVSENLTTDDDDDASSYVGDKYTGVTIVSSTILGSFESENTVVYLNEKSSSVDLTCAEICFTEASSYVDGGVVPLDIVLSNIPSTGTDSYGVDSATPTNLEGEVYASDTISEVSNVSISFDGDVLYIYFSCEVAVSGMSYQFDVEFNTEGQVSGDDSDTDGDGNIDDAALVLSFDADLETYAYYTDQLELSYINEDIPVTLTVASDKESASLKVDGFLITSDTEAPITLEINDIPKGEETDSCYTIESIYDSTGDYELTNVYIQFDEDDANLVNVMFTIEEYDMLMTIQLDNYDKYFGEASYAIIENGGAEYFYTAENTEVKCYLNSTNNTINIGMLLYYYSSEGSFSLTYLMVNDIPASDSDDADYVAESTYDSTGAYQVKDVYVMSYPEEGNCTTVNLSVVIDGSEFGVSFSGIPLSLF